MNDYYKVVLNNIKQCSPERLDAFWTANSDCYRLNEGCSIEDINRIIEEASSDKVIYTTKKELINEYIKILPEMKKENLFDIAENCIKGIRDKTSIKIKDVSIRNNYIIDKIYLQIEYKYINEKGYTNTDIVNTFIYIGYYLEYLELIILLDK